jgi:hypothetical protein
MYLTESRKSENSQWNYTRIWMILETLWNRNNIIKQALNTLITQLFPLFLYSTFFNSFSFSFFSVLLLYIALPLPSLCFFLLSTFTSIWLSIILYPSFFRLVQGFPILYLRRIIPEIIVNILRNSYVWKIGQNTERVHGATRLLQHCQL